MPNKIVINQNGGDAICISGFDSSGTPQKSSINSAPALEFSEPDAAVLVKWLNDPEGDWYDQDAAQDDKGTEGHPSTPLPILPPKS